MNFLALLLWLLQMVSARFKPVFPHPTSLLLEGLAKETLERGKGVT